VGNHAPPDRPLNEEDWNTDARLSYVYAKAEAEKKAWEFARENEMNMVAINPGAIIGPGFYRHTPSTAVLEQVMRGKLPAIPPYSFTYVDVRDVAHLHLLAYENSQAKGRYIAADKYLSIAELLQAMKTIDPEIKIPGMKLSPFVMRMFTAFDWLGHVFAKQERQITLSSISEFANRRSCLSGEKARMELGWQPMDFTLSLSNTMDWIRKTFIES
jgi:dihydroflavonol-4-reductase